MKKLIVVLILLFICVWSLQPEVSKSMGQLKWQLVRPIQYKLGEHKVSISSSSVQVWKSGDLLFSTEPGKAFIGGSTGKLSAKEHRGMFDFKFESVRNCEAQSFDTVLEKSTSVELQGFLSCSKEELPWSLEFKENDKHDLQIQLKLDPQLSRALLSFESAEDEDFFGAGAQFTHLSLKGHNVPIWVSEQGIGRGANPLTFLVNLVANAGGNAWTTYSSSGQILSTELRGFHISNTEYGELDFRNPSKITLDYWSPNINLVVAAEKRPKELLTKLSEYTGRMRPLPDWVHSGAIVGMQGGTEKFQNVRDKLKEYDVPVTAFWLQDWVGQRTTTFGKQLWWNWELDRVHYDNWDELVTELKNENIKVMGYVNPFLTELPEDHRHQTRLRDIAVEKDFLVKDEENQVMDILNTSFSASLLDISQPEARRWLKDIIKQQMVENGIKGWMADFAEALPLDSLLKNADAHAYHNIYPEEWAKLNRELIEELPNSNEYVFFTRAGFTKSPKYSTLFWLGDQMVTWDEHDGLKSSLTGLLSSGLSGISLNHSDIGGYTAVKKYGYTKVRREELMTRWMELNAFTAVFRTHEGNLPEDNVQVYSNERMLEAFAKNAKLYASLFDYRKELIKEASEKAWPLVRSMWLEFPEEKEVRGLQNQFMLGSDILVAPVMEPGVSEVKLFMPKGEWEHFITGEKFIVGSSKWITVPAPIGTPAVFKR